MACTHGAVRLSPDGVGGLQSPAWSLLKQDSGRSDLQALPPQAKETRGGQEPGLERRRFLSSLIRLGLCYFRESVGARALRERGRSLALFSASWSPQPPPHVS